MHRDFDIATNSETIVAPTDITIILTSVLVQSFAILRFAYHITFNVITIHENAMTVIPIVQLDIDCISTAIVFDILDKLCIGLD